MNCLNDLTSHFRKKKKKTCRYLKHGIFLPFRFGKKLPHIMAFSI